MRASAIAAKDAVCVVQYVSNRADGRPLDKPPLPPCTFIFLLSERTNVKIWTEAYRPWIMGGDCNAPVICDVPVDGPFDLGGGYQGFLAMSPSGKTFVAESITGAIVGATVNAVRNDIKAADKTVMEEQVAHAKKRVLSTAPVSPNEFWRLLRAL